jgi:hypothetical protein
MMVPGHLGAGGELTVRDSLDRDTEPLATQDQDEPGWVLGGRYRVLDRLGTGGMAEVFRAHDQLLDRDVAVKVFRTAMDGADEASGEVRRELELQSLAQLSHPNLITLFDGSVDGAGPAYLVLEMVHGPDLAGRLHDGPLPEPEVREIGAQLAEALAYVHAHGMVHRDVKPANILLGIDDTTTLPGSMRARLSDFGIVRLVGSSRMTSTDLTLGTASYVAPEQARGSNVGPAADVYSLGLVLTEALTGQRCFAGPVYETLAARLSAPPPIPEDLPAPWPALLAAMTAQDPAARPSAADVAQGLRRGTAPSPAAAVGTGAAAAVGTGPEVAAGAVPLSHETTSALGALGSPVLPWHEPQAAAPRGRRRLGLFLLLAAVVLAGAVGVGAFLVRGGDAGTPPAQVTPPSLGATQHSSRAHASRHSSATQAADVNANNLGSQSGAPKHSKSHAAGRSHAPAAGNSSSAGRSSAARSTSAAPSSSAASPSPSPTTTTPTAPGNPSPQPSG